MHFDLAILKGGTTHNQDHDVVIKLAPQKCAVHFSRHRPGEAEGAILRPMGNLRCEEYVDHDIYSHG